MKDLLIIAGLLSLAVLFSLFQTTLPEVPFQTIGMGEESGIVTREALVIADQGQWEELWQRHTSKDRHPTLPPPVDFTAEMVIALFGGTRSGGHVLQVTKVERLKGKLLVHYALIGPSCSKCSLPTGMSRPFHIVKLERWDLPVEFRRE